MSATAFDSYKDKYEHVRMERQDGILQLTMHSDGGELVWGYGPKTNMAYMLADVGNDPENKVIILTGSGDGFIRKEFIGSGGKLSPNRFGTTNHFEGKKLLMNHLEIQAPMIAAINGPATIHAELGLLCDIVLAADGVYFQDSPHFVRGLLPGDGVQVVWPMLLGPNRGRSFLLMGKKIEAAEALQLGLVAEVMPKEQLLDRAWEVAREIVKLPPMTVRLTREAILHPIKMAMQQTLGYGLALEGIAGLAHWPFDPDVTNNKVDFTPGAHSS